MHAELSFDLGLESFFHLGAGFDEISLVANLLVVPVVMGVGVIKVGHDCPLDVLVGLYADLFAVTADQLFAKAHN